MPTTYEDIRATLQARPQRWVGTGVAGFIGSNLLETLLRLDQKVEFRLGDVRHSVADIHKARKLLGFEPTHELKQGLALCMDWYRLDAKWAFPGSSTPTRAHFKCSIFTSTRPSSVAANRLNAARLRSMLRPSRTRSNAGPRSVIVTITLRRREAQLTRSLVPSA